MSVLGANTTLSQVDDTAVVEDWEFLRLNDQAPGDVPEEYEAELTRGDAVEIFASIFGRGSCGQADAADAYTGPEAGYTAEQSAANYLTDKYSGLDGVQQLAAEFGIGDLCRPETLDGGEIERQVYLHASSDWIFDDYDIVSYDADLSSPSYRDQDVYVRIEFANTSYAPIYYFVDIERLSNYMSNSASYGDVYEWRGAVKDADGNTVDDPSWTIDNGRVYFPGNWSGILIFKRLPIKYHMYTIKIGGTVGADATRHYDARVSAKAPGLSAVHLDISEEETAEETKEDCPWLDFDFGPNASGTGIETSCGNCDENEEDQEPEEPEEPVCDDPITAEEYNEECCGGPLPGCLPQCRKTEEVVHGPVAGEEPDEYCGETSIITLMPEGGKPCGTMTKTWSADNGGCKCPEDSYFHFHVIENYVDIYKDGVIYSESKLYTGCTGFDVFFYIPPGSSSTWTVKAYNYPKDGSGVSQGRQIKFDFVIGGELIAHVDVGECTAGSGDSYPGGEFYSGDFECGY